jgi:hypothetical protein
LCNIELPELFDVNRVNILEELLNIPVNRTSQDIAKNQYGNRLLELCKCNDLYVLLMVELEKTTLLVNSLEKIVVLLIM